MLSTHAAPLNFDGPLHAAVRTPGGALKTRGALRENTHGPRTGNSKAGFAKSVAPKTPFQSKTLQDGKHATATVARTRPLLDKTPFPNRTSAVAAAVSKTVLKLALLSPLLNTPVLRPSSSRKRTRVPSGGRAFETPVTQGNHWDVSDVSILVEPAADTSIEEEDVDEVEYMPPSAIEVPYEPPFDLPNYKDVGHTLFRLMHSYHMDDADGAFFDYGDEEELLQASGFVADHKKWERLPLAPLADDDPFKASRQGRTKIKALPSKLSRPATVAEPIPKPVPVPRPPITRKSSIPTMTRAPSVAQSVSSAAASAAGRTTRTHTGTVTTNAAAATTTAAATENTKAKTAAPRSNAVRTTSRTTTNSATAGPAQMATTRSTKLPAPTAVVREGAAAATPPRTKPRLPLSGPLMRARSAGVPSTARTTVPVATSTNNGARVARPKTSIAVYRPGVRVGAVRVQKDEDVVLIFDEKGVVSGEEGFMFSV